MTSLAPAPDRHPLGIAAGLRLFFLWAPIAGYASMWLLDTGDNSVPLLFVARWSILASWVAMLLIATVETTRLRRNGGRMGSFAIIACTLAAALAINLAVLLFTAMLASLATFD